MPEKGDSIFGVAGGGLPARHDSTRHPDVMGSDSSKPDVDVIDLACPNGEPVRDLYIHSSAKSVGQSYITDENTCLAHVHMGKTEQSVRKWNHSRMGPKGKLRSKKECVVALGIDQGCCKGRTVVPGDIDNETEPLIDVLYKS